MRGPRFLSRARDRSARPQEVLNTILLKMIYWFLFCFLAVIVVTVSRCMAQVSAVRSLTCVLMDDGRGLNSRKDSAICTRRRPRVTNFLLWFKREIISPGHGVCITSIRTTESSPNKLQNCDFPLFQDYYVPQYILVVCKIPLIGLRGVRGAYEHRWSTLE
jgi:hypothetical protein